MIIAVDFDNTLAKNEFPDIGPEIPGAIEWCKRLQSMGALIVLNTARYDTLDDDSTPKAEAVGWAAQRGLYFQNEPQPPGRDKISASVYVDDKGWGMAHMHGFWEGCVDWDIVGPDLMDQLLKEQETLQAAMDRVRSRNPHFEFQSPQSH